MLVGLSQSPRIFDRCIKSCTGQVHTGGTAVRMEDFGFETGQNAHGLRVTLESANIARDFGERPLPVVPERRMAKIMGQASAVDHIRIAAKHCAYLSTDLGDFQRVGEAGASEIIGTSNQNLAFRAETPQGGRMYQPCAVTLKSGTGFGLRRFRCPTLFIKGTVASSLSTRSPSCVVSIVQA